MASSAHAAGFGALGSGVLGAALAPEDWLGPTRAPFARLADSSPAVGGPEVHRFFAARRLGLDPALARALVSLDVRTIAHALSLLLFGNGQALALQPVPAAVREVLRDDPPVLDHVGIELFGRLEWYLNLVEAWASTGAIAFGGYRIFHSVQVRKALASDPELGDVRIARVYVETGQRDVNLELFEVDQHWLYTVARRVSLFAGAAHDSLETMTAAVSPRVQLPLDPVDHCALRVARWQTVAAVHRVLEGNDSPDTRLYDGGLSYNHGDASLNCKFLSRSAELGGRPVFDRVTEFVSYGVAGDPRVPQP